MKSNSFSKFLFEVFVKPFDTCGYLNYNNNYNNNNNNNYKEVEIVNPIIDAEKN